MLYDWSSRWLVDATPKTENLHLKLKMYWFPQPVASCTARIYVFRVGWTRIKRPVRLAETTTLQKPNTFNVLKKLTVPTCSCNHNALSTVIQPSVTHTKQTCRQKLCHSHHSHKCSHTLTIACNYRKHGSFLTQLVSKRHQLKPEIRHSQHALIQNIETF